MMSTMQDLKVKFSKEKEILKNSTENKDIT